MAGHSPSKTGVNALMSPAIHVFLPFFKDVDARHKAGHDAFRGEAESYGIFFTGFKSRPNSRAALAPRMLRLACSFRNGRS